MPVCRAGLAADFSEADLKKKLDETECLIRVVLHGRGNRQARVLDLRLHGEIHRDQCQLSYVTLALLACLAFASARGDAHSDVIDLFGSLAAALTEVNVPAFMDGFDKDMPGYGDLKNQIDRPGESGRSYFVDRARRRTRATTPNTPSIWIGSSKSAACSTTDPSSSAAK